VYQKKRYRCLAVLVSSYGILFHHGVTR
jgi:hypothetical protein